MQNKGIIEKFTPFLAELKHRIIITFSVFAVSTISGFVFYEDIIKFLVRGLNLEKVNIVFTSPFQFINLAISCGIATGLVITFPLIVSQLLSFLKPALKQKEFQLVLNYIPYSIFLFLTGFLLGAIVMKWQVEIFLQSTLNLGIGNVLDISKLLSTVLLTSTFLGVGFQFPIVILILGKLNILQHQTLAKQRKWIYLIALLFAILLPVDSILIDLFLALPLVLLFEFTLLSMKKINP